MVMSVLKDMILHSVCAREGLQDKSNGGESDGRMYVIQTTITLCQMYLMALEERKE